MGLLDALLGGSQGGYGGLLDGLMYPSPVSQKPEYNPYAGINTMFDQSAPQPPSNPFGPAPQFAPALPQSVFASGAGSIAPSPGMMPQQATATPPAPVVAPAPQVAQAPQDSPINTMNVGGYQMPQFGSAQDYTPQLAPQTAQALSTDISAQSRAAPQQQQLPTSPGGFSEAMRGLGMNMAAGPLGMLAGGVMGAMGKLDPSPRDIQSAQHQAITQALIANGETPQVASSKAMIAVMNPEAAKTILPELFTNKQKYTQTGEDSFGNKQYGFVNELQGTVNGKELGAGGSEGSTSGFLAPGVKQIDSGLKGEDYLKQFSPEVQAAVQNYVEGKSMPTGNPRKGFTQTVKMIAQKYGTDTDQTVDDATYSARRTMRNQLSSSAPSSLGGQINIGNTAAGHLADLTQKAVELGNVDTGIAPLTAIVNNTRGLGTEQAAKMEALKGAAQHYGQEITKFYAGSPGGTAERDRFIESVNGARSPKELAAILSTEGELMRSRLDALGGQIKGVLGDEGMKQYPVLRPDGEAALAKVEQNVSRLRGGQGAAAPANGLPSGWSVKVH